MAMDRTRVAVEIYGTSYKLVGSSTEYMKQVARYVDEHMRAISKSHSRLDTPRIAVLAAVHMAEQAIQVQDFKNELNMLTGERTELRVEVSRPRSTAGAAGGIRTAGCCGQRRGSTADCRR